jgi:hypothetical protein
MNRDLLKEKMKIGRMEGWMDARLGQRVQRRPLAKAAKG